MKENVFSYLINQNHAKPTILKGLTLKSRGRDCLLLQFQKKFGNLDILLFEVEVIEVLH